MRPSQRVLAENSELAGQEIDDVTVDPAMWRSVCPTMEMANCSTLELDVFG